MEHPEVVYEIELKSLLTEQDYHRLLKELPNKFKQINEETITTTRYRPGDIRLRTSDKTKEIVCKHGDPTTICRKEIKIPIQDDNYLEHFRLVLETLNFKPDRPWTKTKHEFETHIGEHKYVICLQYIKDFAYILEVKHLSTEDKLDPHKSNLGKITKDLGCEPINAEEFTKRINAFRSGSSTI